MARFQTLNAPEGIRRGDVVVLRTETLGVKEERRYTVRNVIFGLQYSGDEHRRIVLTFEEHLGALCLPNVPLSEYKKDNLIGFVRVERNG